MTVPPVPPLAPTATPRQLVRWLEAQRRWLDVAAAGRLRAWAAAQVDDTRLLAALALDRGPGIRHLALPGTRGDTVVPLALPVSALTPRLVEWLADALPGRALFVSGWAAVFSRRDLPSAFAPLLADPAVLEVGRRSSDPHSPEVRASWRAFVEAGHPFPTALRRTLERLAFLHARDATLRTTAVLRGIDAPLYLLACDQSLPPETFARVLRTALVTRRGDEERGLWRSLVAHPQMTHGAVLDLLATDQVPDPAVLAVARSPWGEDLAVWTALAAFHHRPSVLFARCLHAPTPDEQRALVAQLFAVDAHLGSILLEAEYAGRLRVLPREVLTRVLGSSNAHLRERALLWLATADPDLVGFGTPEEDGAPTRHAAPRR